MRGNVWIYIAVMSAVSFAVRVLPLTLIRRQIENRFLRSFLYYVPYVTLAVMTFPAILSATGSRISAWAGFAAALLIAYIDGTRCRVAIGACIVVYVAELLI